jgi:anaerobic selenocysteine-containing dehydrogenase
VTTTADWQQTACILCECNCGIEVRLGGADGRRFERIRGDKAHPASRGYTCEKALRLDHYQNDHHRLTSPLRRRGDGTFEEIDWDTAISEIAQRFAAVRDTWGGESIFYYGGGGQGNHLGGAYATATRAALGSRFRSNALAQEKTGEFWVDANMLGTYVRGDFDHAEVAVFLGKNPWHSHGLPRARTTLKEIARDPARCLIVVDPRRTETAELADIHLQVRPGTDAWCLAALCATFVDEGLLAGGWLAEHATGLDDVVALLRRIPIDRFAEVTGIAEEEIRSTARRIAAATSVAVYEDLGIQMSLHSTLASYLDKLLWLLTGNFAVPGAQYVPSTIVSLAGSSVSGRGSSRRSPVAGARIISGLVPCNVIADEILTDHPDRYRAMLVESANPAHSLADGPRMREALRALELLVVIDISLTETARLADYVLPAASQYEKWEATFFNFDFPANVFHLRPPVVEALPGTLAEPEIHARLCAALGAVTDEDLAPLAAAASRGRVAFAEAFFATVAAKPELGRLAPVVLYRTLGPTLSGGAAAAAVLWAAAHRCAASYPESVARAGYGTPADPLAMGEALFEAIIASPSGVVFTLDEPEVAWNRLGTDDGRIHLAIEEMLAALDELISAPPPGDVEFPFVLTAGERRSFTANTIIRDPAWRKRDPAGALRIAPADAERLGVVTGELLRVTTRRGSALAPAELDDAMQPGHVSLPNGLGLAYPGGDGADVVTGVAPNELTSSEDRDFLAGTPFHKHVRAKVERLDRSVSLER